MRGKVIIGGIIALMVLIGVVVSQRRQIVEIRKEKATYQRNFETATSGIESYRKANGELVAKVNVLELKSSELGRYSVKLEQDIKALNVKLKNAKAAKVIEYVYIYKTDTILIRETAPNRYFASLTDEWIKLEQWISVDDKPSIDSLSLEVRDKLTLIDEVEYKGRWFWRKPIGVKLHLKSENPYLNIDRMESIEFRK